MANPEHLAILNRGVERWNEWREKRPDLQPDLRMVDLENTSLRDEFGRVDYSAADLSEADLRGANLTKLDLTMANFAGSRLDGANLREARLFGANLGAADLCGANLRGADLLGANLGSVRAGGSHVLLMEVGADLSGADLGGANLGGANLSGTDLRGADFTGAWIYGTNFADVDLSTAKGLESVDHRGPSTVGIDTIYKSRGKIPEVFLRGCGVPDEFIAYIGSMVGRAIEFYSCFISYSSKDQEFAERLHADLQAKGVRCWFAREDLKIGDQFQERIEESIRVHDKLLLVLSESSVASPGVKREVQAAFEREDRSGKPVLFPIRVDEAVMEATQAWAADIRRTRHIGEFGNWRDHESYKKALERLLRDLKNSG
jgi:TIR domain/Pentapeptide repeats (8 copies)